VRAFTRRRETSIDEQFVQTSLHENKLSAESIQQAPDAVQNAEGIAQQKVTRERYSFSTNFSTIMLKKHEAIWPSDDPMAG